MVRMEELIARQIAEYDGRRRLEQTTQRPGRGQVGGTRYGPYVLVSREQGSGGHTVARLVGERLGWQVFDREIVDEIARRTQVRRQLIESLDERKRSLADDLLTPLLDRHDIGKVGYLHHLKRVVLALGQQGNVVMVGRGARHLLPRQFGLSVRLVAPLETRAQRIADESGIPLSCARVKVQMSDDERAGFIQHTFHRPVGDPWAHDLIINTNDLKAVAVAEIVLAALQQKLGVTAPVTAAR